MLQTFRKLLYSNLSDHSQLIYLCFDCLHILRLHSFFHQQFIFFIQKLIIFFIELFFLELVIKFRLYKICNFLLQLSNLLIFTLN